MHSHNKIETSEGQTSIQNCHYLIEDPPADLENWLLLEVRKVGGDTFCCEEP